MPVRTSPRAVRSRRDAGKGAVKGVAAMIHEGLLSLVVALLFAGAPTPAVGQASPTNRTPSPPAAGGAMTGAVGETQTGLAAYYNQRLQGRRTASGEGFDNGALTTAHASLPFGTRARVTNAKNNRSVVLRVNDRGPTQPGRVVDVSRAAAGRLGFVRAGLTEVNVEVVEAAKPRAARAKAAQHVPDGGTRVSALPAAQASFAK